MPHSVVESGYQPTVNHNALVQHQSRSPIRGLTRRYLRGFAVIPATDRSVMQPDWEQKALAAWDAQEKSLRAEI